MSIESRLRFGPPVIVEVTDSSPPAVLKARDAQTVFQDLLVAFVAERQAIQNNRRLTAEGKAERIIQLRDAKIKEIEEVRARTVGPLHEPINKARVMIEKRLQGDRESAVVESQRREIRDGLRRLAPHMRMEQFKKAIEHRDLLFVQAIRDFNDREQLINPDTLTEGLRLLARDLEPHAAAVVEMHQPAVEAVEWDAADLTEALRVAAPGTVATGEADGS